MSSSWLCLLVLLLAGPAVHTANGNLSSLCCGDNFCCAILARTSKASCWGGNLMASKVLTTGTVKALACGGKAVMGVDANMEVSFYVGSDGYAYPTPHPHQLLLILLGLAFPHPNHFVCQQSLILLGLARPAGDAQHSTAHYGPSQPNFHMRIRVQY